MFASHFNRHLSRGVLALALAAAAGLASAETMHVVLDTSGFTGYAGAGWLDLQFNPGSATAALAGATVSNLSGFDAAVAALPSGAVQSLAGGYLINNSSGYNDLFSAVHLGGKVSFDVSFSGAADPTGQLAGSLFGVALYGGADSNTVTQLGNADANTGNLAQFAWQPARAGSAGSVATTVFDGAVVTVSAVPEPSGWLMLGAGLALVGVATRRKPRGAVAAA